MRAVHGKRNCQGLTAPARMAETALLWRGNEHALRSSVVCLSVTISCLSVAQIDPRAAGASTFGGALSPHAPENSAPMSLSAVCHPRIRRSHWFFDIHCARARCSGRRIITPAARPPPPGVHGWPPSLQHQHAPTAAAMASICMPAMRRSRKLREAVRDARWRQPSGAQPMRAGARGTGRAWIGRQVPVRNWLTCFRVSQECQRRIVNFISTFMGEPSHRGLSNN